jgi:hypothetical protein
MYNNKVACFIHSTNIDIHKTEILDSMISYLNERNIFDKLDFLLINNIGNELDETYYKNINKKIIVVNYSKDINLFECVTIKQLITFSKINIDYKILYLHTKGVSHNKNSIHMNNIIFWSNYMLYCLVDNLNSCTDLLDTYDTVGCNFRERCIYSGNNMHYSGNFWWANSSYLGKLNLTDFNKKYDAEFNILSKNPHYHNIYTIQNMYEQNYPLDFYKNDIVYSFKEQKSASNLYYCKIGWNGVGLCNQLYSLLSCLFKCINLNTYDKIIVVDDFLTDINTNIYVSADKVFDFEIMNMYLKKYNIFILSKNNITLNIKSIVYGYASKEIDITQKVIEKYTTKNSLYISNSVNLNELSGDPCHGVVKNIYIKYTLNNCDYIIYDIFKENEVIDINFNEFKKVNWHTQNNIINERNKNINLITELLVKIKFKDKYKLISDNFINDLNIGNKRINVIHIRNEDDAIPFWANINKLTNETYKSILEDKYINLIKKYINNDTINIILSMNTSNKVIDFLKDNNYNYFICNKNIINGREENAIVDLINGSHCNNIYIGNFNMTTNCGSTFSYVLYKLLEHKADLTKILIDLDNINDTEIVI